MSLSQNKIEGGRELNKDDFQYWDNFTQQTKDIFTWKKIVAIITIIAIFVQLLGMMIEPSNWLIWNLLTFIVATNLGAVVLAIIAQKTADDIKNLYQTAFDADLYHTLHIMSRFKNKFLSEVEKQGNDLEEELDELSPNLYSFFKGYLEVFNEQYKKEESEIVKRTYEDVDISELFNEEHDNV
tara:strand:+ start:919 stop:1467 length:549 start_codon:yes stop_codon:yes gene_type:complete